MSSHLKPQIGMLLHILELVLKDLIIAEDLINGVVEEALVLVVVVAEEVLVVGHEPVLNVEMKAICLENVQLEVILVMKDHEDASSVEKKATSHLNVLMKLNQEWEEEEVGVLELALNVEKKVTCRENALLLVVEVKDPEGALNVAKKATSPLNVLQLPQVVVDLVPVLNAEKKVICQENVPLLVEAVIDLEAALIVVKRAICLVNVLKKENQEWAEEVVGLVHVTNVEKKVTFQETAQTLKVKIVVVEVEAVAEVVVHMNNQTTLEINLWKILLVVVLGQIQIMMTLLLLAGVLLLGLKIGTQLLKLQLQQMVVAGVLPIIQKNKTNLKQQSLILGLLQQKVISLQHQILGLMQEVTQ